MLPSRLADDDEPQSYVNKAARAAVDLFGGALAHCLSDDLSDDCTLDCVASGVVIFGDGDAIVSMTLTARAPSGLTAEVKTTVAIIDGAALVVAH